MTKISAPGTFSNQEFIDRIKRALVTIEEDLNRLNEPFIER
ncbi:hypothetical protein [Oceanicoccus sp. KOV_DT_Chl]|nr:hypothetical protein [Oceanicoccus sp. KOV_DT_Chl]